MREWCLAYRTRRQIFQNFVWKATLLGVCHMHLSMEYW